MCQGRAQFILQEGAAELTPRHTAPAPLMAGKHDKRDGRLRWSAMLGHRRYFARFSSDIIVFAHGSKM